MKLTKRDVAEGLGMTYQGTSWEYEGDYELEYHEFNFNSKRILINCYAYSVDEAWEEAADKLLEPLVDYLLGNLDDE